MNRRSLRLAESIGLALAIAAVSWLGSLSANIASHEPAIRLAQEFAAPIGEEDGPIGGPTMYGQDVGNGPVGGPTMYGQDVGNAPIGGPMIYGGDVGDAPIGGAMVGGGPVESGDDGDPIGGEPLY